MDTIKINVGGVAVDIDKEQVTKAIEEGELKVESDSIKVFDLTEKEVEGRTTNDFELFKNNVSKESYDSGKIAGEEMIVKKAKEEFGVEIQDKDFLSFGNALKTKIESGIKVEPNEKIKELQSDINQYKAKLDESNNKFTALVQERENERINMRIDSTINGAIPSDKITIKSDQATALFKMEYQVGFDDDGQFVKDKQGNIVKNENNLQRQTVNDLMPDWLQSNNFVKGNSGGSGGGDDGGAGKPGTVAEFTKRMESEGLKAGSDDFNRRMMQEIKDGTLKV